jgi:hypothetical protein
MNEEEIKLLIEENIDQATSFVNSEVNADREIALDYYLRKPYGNEVPGKSNVVTGEVAEAVDGALPQLMKVFTQPTDVVEFTPTNDGDAKVAEDVTTYVNHIFNKDNEGAILLHNWFWDALVQKNGIIKAYWNEAKEPVTESYEGLDLEELTVIMQGDNVEVIEQEEVREPQPPMPNEQGEVINIPDLVTYNVKIKRHIEDSKVKIENVPTEEFLIDSMATSIQDARFVCQRSLVTRAELVELGYDKGTVEELPLDDANVSTMRDYRRDGSYSLDDETSDKTQQLITYYECYLDVGDNNGEANKHRICYAGKTILADDEIDYVPFYSLCPFPIPHQFYGQSLADRTMDLQFIKSTITRQMLDNLYLTNNSRVGVVEGQVNIDDVLNSTAGGVIRMKNPAAIVPMQVQSSAAQSFPMLQYLDEVQSKRTGVNDMNQGLDANVLQNVSATAIATMTAQSQGKLELMARIFADTGVKELMQGILHLVCKYQDKERMLLIAGNPVTIDPTEWKNLYKVSINVGLGNGGTDEKIGMLQMVLAKQEMIIQQYGLGNPLVDIKQYRDTLAKFINISGMRDDAQFLKEITDEQSQQMAQQAQQSANQSPPEVQAAEAIAKAEMEKAQMKQQTDMAAQQLKMQEMQMKVQMEQQELELKAKEQQIEAARDLLKVETERAKLEADISAKEIELAIKMKEVDNKEEDNDMKTVLSAVDKMAKANNAA